MNEDREAGCVERRQRSRMRQKTEKPVQQQEHRCEEAGYGRSREYDTVGNNRKENEYALQ